MRALNVHVCNRIELDRDEYIIHIFPDGTISFPRDVLKGSSAIKLSEIKKSNFSCSEKILRQAEDELEAIKIIVDSIGSELMVCKIEVVEGERGFVKKDIPPRGERCPECGKVQSMDRSSSISIYPSGSQEFKKSSDCERSAGFIQGLITAQKITGINTGAILRDFVSNTLLTPFNQNEKEIIFRRVEDFIKRSSLENDWILSIFRDFARETMLAKVAWKNQLRLIIPVNPKSGVHIGDIIRESVDDCSKRGDIPYHLEYIKNHGAVLWDIILPGQISTSPLIEDNKKYLEGGWNGLFFYGPFKEIGYRFYIEYLKKDGELDISEWKRFAPPCRKKYRQDLRNRLYWVKIKSIEKLPKPQKLEEFIKQSDNNPLRTSFLRNFTIVREKSARNKGS